MVDTVLGYAALDGLSAVWHRFSSKPRGLTRARVSSRSARRLGLHVDDSSPRTLVVDAGRDSSHRELVLLSHRSRTNAMDPPPWLGRCERTNNSQPRTAMQSNSSPDLADV